MPATATINTRGIQGESLSAATDRLVNTVLLAEGVVDKAGNSYRVLQNLGTDMNVKVGSGTAFDRAVVQGDSAGQGTFIPEHQNPSQVLAIAASDPTLPRKDIVILRVYDDTFDSSGNDYADVEVVTGTPNASPVEPSLPSSALKLAVVDVAAAVTQIVDGNITDSRVEARLTSNVVTPTSTLRMERITSNQSIPNSIDTVIIFNSTVFEVDETARITPNTSTGVVTVNEAGIYRVTAGLVLGVNSTGRRSFSIVATPKVVAEHDDDAAASFWTTSISGLVKLAATNTIDARIYQTSGGSLDVSVSSKTFLSVEWVGPAT